MNENGPCATNVSIIKPIVALSTLCLVAYATGLGTIPVLDRAEARFVEITAGLLESWPAPSGSHNGTQALASAALVHWLQAAVVYLFSVSDDRAIWTYRLVSTFAAWVSVLLAFSIAREMLPARGALVAALFFAVSPLMIVASHIASADMVFLATVMCAQWALARAYLAPSSGRPVSPMFAVLFWGAVVLSIHTRGGLGPAIIGLTAATLCLADRSVGWLRPLWPLLGFAVAAVTTTAIYWSLGRLAGSVSEFLELALSSLPRPFGLGAGASGAPPGTHLVFLLAGLGPAFPFLALTLRAAIGARRDPRLRFCLAWAIPVYIAAELVAHKLPTHTLPVYPALAILAAWGLHRATSESLPVERIVLSVWGLLSASFSLLVIGYLAIPTWQPGLASADVFSLAIINLMGALATVIFAAAGRLRAVAAVTMTTTAAVTVCGIAFAFPRIETFWMTDRIVEAIEARGGLGERRLIAVGYAEPSLVFRTGSDTEIVDARDAVGFLDTGDALIFAVEDLLRPTFESRAATAGRFLLPSSSVSGFNYAAGRWVTVWLYFPQPQH